MAFMSPADNWVRISVPVNERVAIALYKLTSCCEYRVVGNQFGVFKGTAMNYAVLSEYITTGNVLTATLHFPLASWPCERACEMWVREGSTDAWNETCDTVFADVCGNRNITIYVKEHCEKIPALNRSREELQINQCGLFQ
ncbi:hypothetical protein V5799_027191 [Amblyomma americanum]|uniref:Lipocalin n=1 Tax=Amblyomma americanum TaxID=6943 RepID=A0AAQ4DGF2_AMBAM